jgi:GNAT acetyltransferase-like protein
MRLYSRDDLDTIPWPPGADGDYARRVLTPFVRDGTRPYIANVSAEVRVLIEGAVVSPVAVVDSARQLSRASYVASPTTHYIDYARREVQLELADRPVLRRLLPPLMEALRPVLSGGQIEQAVYVNNWLLSTNLYPALSPDALRGILTQLVETFPRHAIVFRSVNDRLDGGLAGALAALGCRRVFSRQVYILDPRKGEYLKKKSYQKDRSLARRSPYRWLSAAQLTPADCPRLKELYDDLYLDKYSRYNPQFTEAFFREALRSQWLTLFALKREERIDGVLGFVERQGVMTTPLIGYDRSVPAEAGLYRLISFHLIEEAATRGLILHQSSGAAAFKQHRGSAPAMEYSFVYDRRLSPRRRLPWKLLAALSEYVVVPMMRRLGL